MKEAQDFLEITILNYAKGWNKADLISIKIYWHLDMFKFSSLSKLSTLGNEKLHSKNEAILMLIRCQLE